MPGPMPSLGGSMLGMGGGMGMQAPSQGGGMSWDQFKQQTPQMQQQMMDGMQASGGVNPAQNIPQHVVPPQAQMQGPQQGGIGRMMGGGMQGPPPGMGPQGMGGMMRPPMGMQKPMPTGMPQGGAMQSPGMPRPPMPPGPSNMMPQSNAGQTAMPPTMPSGAPGGGQPMQAPPSAMAMALRGQSPM
jgi:hypothetical protein